MALPGFDEGCDDDGCAATPPGLSMAMIFSLTPFIATFVVVFMVISKKVFPLLSRIQQDDGEDHYLPPTAPAALRLAHADRGSRSLRRRLASATFSTTTALATVLAELILAEMSEVIDPTARNAALRITVPSLLFLLVILIPFLELQSVVTGSGLSFQRTSRGKIPRITWTVQLVAFGAWLVLFWSLGVAVPGPVQSYMYSHDAQAGFDSTGIAMASRWDATNDDPLDLQSLRSAGPRGLARACLERIGVIGISLMALLSGFASVSSPWQTYNERRSSRRRPITESDVSRKEVSLSMTSDMLMTKRHRLQSLQLKAMVLADPSRGASAAGQHLQANQALTQQPGMFGKLVGSIKSVVSGETGDAAEIKNLEMEINGLEVMEAGLITSLAALRSKRATEARAGTPLGRLLLIPQYIFGAYCVYRIVATSLTMLNRLFYPGATYTSSDPVSRVLGVVAHYWDPKLDQNAWGRQISFLLSGVILLASANSVLQTFNLFVRWTPKLLHQAQANLALMIGQIAATYVISSALLLRSNLPKEMGSAVSDALESALEPGFVDRWFEGWFLLASVLTAFGLYVGRKISAGDVLDGYDEYGMEEMGTKRSLD
ncbi:g protein-coupled receptor [Ophiostoma piceae UAMH 11346]|uniref:G protein-coupled receptor n=1 Tax=Ophiostoma piceae (strain UAMH 11346) TaxID=1262450 RepID=S3CW69_OPHP1|nr:g protein-coupled receptor [Ophiostoma piceae UAMH 11346]